MNYKGINPPFILIALLIGFFNSCNETDNQTVKNDEQTSEGLRASGASIVDENGNTVLLQGVNLGQWLLMEGFMSGSNGNMTQSNMKRKLYMSGVSRAQIEDYFQKYRDNFITKADIAFIASKGYNCIRLPLHYELFLTEEQRERRLDVIYEDGALKETAYNRYKDSLENWSNTNNLAVDEDIEGFKIIDNMVRWCKANNIYLILDMHAVPGTVGDNAPITDEMMEDFEWGGRDFFHDFKNRSALHQIWDKISERYAQEPTICMYDLINEPHHRPSGSLVDLTSSETLTLRNSYNQMIDLIRANGDNTLIMLQGGDFGNDYLSSDVSLYPSDFNNTSNLVYNFHRYRANNSKTYMGSDEGNLSNFGAGVSFSKTHNVPLFCGETGLDDDYARLRENLQNMSELGFGWTLWTFKTHTDRNDLNYKNNRVLFDVGGGNIWDDVEQWENGTLFENIKFENCSINPIDEFWKAVAPQ